MQPTDAIALAALLLASFGWLAFAREHRAHQNTQGRLWASRRELARLTDRDERGRFKKSASDAVRDRAER